MPEISKIILYDEAAVSETQLDDIKKFIADTFSIKVESKRGIVQTLNNSDDKNKILEEISSTKIFDLKKQFQKQKNVLANTNIQTEIVKKNIINNSVAAIKESNNAMTTLYDGFELQKTITKFLPKDEDAIDILHVIVTNKLVCTFDDEDYRYHARALISANPTIISTSGIVEAPAKPKQYYIDMITCYSKEQSREINARYQDEFLKYNDSRLNDVIKGYVLQAIIYYYYAEEAFCKNKECRLFNAHWQKDLIYSQVTNKKFCKKHADMIDKLKDRCSAKSAGDK